MPSHAEKCILPHSPEQMFDLVADIETYPQFLPWCLSTSVYKNEGDEICADMVIGFKMFRESFVTTVTLDTGIAIKPTESAISGWDLVPSGSEEPLLEVRRRWDNDYPLWYQFVVPAGSYDIWMVFKGSDEPLPVGEGVEIRQGELLEFDSGV